MLHDSGVRRVRRAFGELLLGLTIVALVPVHADGCRERALEAVRVENVALALELLPAAIAEEADPEEQAKLRLLLALMYRWNKQFDAAIAELKRVAEYDPGQEANFYEQRITGLNAPGGLAECYEQKGDLGATIYWAERGLAIWPRSEGMFTLSYFAREELAARGELRAGPLVKWWGVVVPSRMDTSDQAIVVPASALAERSGASLERDEGGGTLTLATEDGGSVALCMGSRVATVDGEASSSPVAPEVIEDELWVPLRFVVEALGWEVYWDASLRIAYVRKPAPAE